MKNVAVGSTLQLAKFGSNGGGWLLEAVSTFVFGLFGVDVGCAPLFSAGAKKVVSPEELEFVGASDRVDC